MARDISYTKVLSNNSSFQLVRTNPKLTGNLKITVNQAGEMWLDSIKANLELAKEEYSRFPIDVDQSLASNIHQFFKNGETPNEIIFGLAENVDTTKASTDFKDQFDFSNYFSGARYFPSNKYSEKLSYFAPLYLKKDLPNYFVIFKIQDPLNYKVDVSKQNYGNITKDQYLIDLFKSATIIKTFDLRETSAPGKFIRKYTNDPAFPISPLSVSFGEDEFTKWNGIIVKDGTFGNLGELLYTTYSQSTPLKFFEEVITTGYSRNGIIFPNILNLEFIFDDDTSNNYEFNRYFGVYVDAIPLASLEVDLDRAYAERGTWPNSPRLRRKYSNYEETTLLQENSTGVVFPYKNIGLNLSEFSDIFSDAESLYFNYLIDKNSNVYLPKLNQPYSIDFTSDLEVVLTKSSPTSTTIVATSVNSHGFNTNDLVFITSTDSQYSGKFFVTKISDSSFSYVVTTTPTASSVIGNAKKESGFGKIVMSNEKLDYADFFGPELPIFLQDAGKVSEFAGFSHGAIQILNPLNHSDSFKIYHPNGSRSDVNGNYDLITATINYSVIPNPGDFYAFNDDDGVIGYDVFYFNGSGSPSDIVKGLVGCLNRVSNRTFTAYAYDDYAFILCNSAGDFDISHALTFNSPLNDYSTVEIDAIGGNQLIGNIVNFTGGSRPTGNRLVIDREHFSKIDGIKQDLLVKTEKGWSKIKKISNYTDLITEANLPFEQKRKEAIQEYQRKIVLTLELEERPSIRYSSFLIKKIYKPQLGLVSLFPIKDLDFDFYASDYLNFPEIDLYQYNYVPAGLELLLPNDAAGNPIDYIVYGGSVDVDGTTYTEGQTFTVAQKTKYTVISGDPIVSYDSATTSLIQPILDDNKELNDFTGFSILKDPAKVVPTETSDVFRLRTKYINGLTQTEYDFYKENESKDFALKSKIIPYINKWAIKEGLDARSNPYRLNTEIVFGRNNFSPDHEDRTQNPNNFTHEWFYIESKFNYLEDAATAKENNYYFENPLDETKLLSDPDYFIEYFTYTPTFGVNSNGEPIDVAPTQFRYSFIFKNEANQYEAFFKGFKVVFKDVVDATTLGANNKPITRNLTSRFEDYAFSCLLKPVKEEFTNLSQPPIKYRVIEHKDYKFILILIEVSMGYLAEINDYWKEQNTYNTISHSSSLSATEIFTTDPSETAFGTDLPYQTINGDYRISFDQVNSLDISNLSHLLLYSLKNKKFNTRLNNYSNIKLPSQLRVFGNGLDASIDPATLRRLPNDLLSNYPTALTDEVFSPKPGEPVAIFNNLNGQKFIIDEIIGAVPQIASPFISVSSEFINFPQVAQLGLTVPIPATPYLSLSSGLPLFSGFENYVKSNFSFSIIKGGEKHFEKLFEKISFAKFKKFINAFDPFIEYESYSLDQNGNSVLSSSPNFYIEIEDTSSVIKTNQLITNPDEDRPAQFSFDEIIAYTYEQANLNNSVQLNRYKGEYEPIAKNVLHCRSNFKFFYNQINDMKLSNVKLNTNVDTLLTLQNFNHIKISPTQILELESDEAYSPVYPKIGEVAIGQADYFLLSSNWDWGFHFQYSGKTSFSAVAGSLRVEEDECFLNKLVILPENIELENFQVTTLAADQSLADLDLSTIELAIKENANDFTGRINLNNVLTRYFIEDGIEQKFNEYLVNSSEFIGNYDSIQEYVVEYIRLNILKVYQVDEVNFFSKRNAALVSTENFENVNSIQFEFLDDKARFEKGYSVLKTVGINNLNPLVLSFTIQKPLDAGLDISPKVKIKFI